MSFATLPSQLPPQRGARLQQFLDLGWPHRKLEAWRYTDLAPLEKRDWVLTDLPADDTAQSVDARDHFALLNSALATTDDDLNSLRPVAAEVAGWPGVDPGLREAVAAALVERPGAGGATAQLTLSVEVDPEQPFAPHVFRRIAWPARLAAGPVWLESAGAIDLPSAASLPETSPDAFHRQCGKACGKPVEREEPSPILQGSRPL